MKFCEKLQKLRKEKGYSQEELADLLDVSRQAVSKWESGTTYPEMDKLLSLCKIFNVTLDDLTNDEVSTEKIKEKNINSFSNLVYTLLEMIGKSMEMFKIMNRREVVKCISELFMLFIILLLFKIPFNILDESVGKIFMNFPSDVYRTLFSIWLFFSTAIYLVLFLSIFIYVYKTRYLDKFDPDKITKFNKEEVTQEKNEELEESTSKKEVIVKTRPQKERHSFIIFDILGTIFNIFVKMFLFFMTIPVVVLFVVFIIITILMLIIQFIGIHYIGLFIAFLGVSIVSFVVMEIFIRLLFSNAIKFKKSFIFFTIGLILGSTGVAVSAVEIANTKYIDDIPSGITTDVYEATINMKDNLVLAPYLYDAIYVVDDTINDIKISVEYYKAFQTIEASTYDRYLYVHRSTNFENFRNIWELCKENLKDKVTYNYDELTKYKVTIITNSKNIELLKANKEQLEKEREEDNNRYFYYEEQINELNYELNKREQKIGNLEENIKQLQNKINDLQERLDNIQNQFR